MIEMHLAKNEFLQAKYVSALEYFEKGWKIIEEIDDRKIWPSATAFRIFAHFWQGNFKEVIRTYEASIPAVEKFPLGSQPILATAAVGYCYALCGQITQGLGMLHALRKHSLEKGDEFLVYDTEVTIAGVMLDLRRPDEAISYLHKYVADDCENDWNAIRAKTALFLAYYLKGRKKDVARHFKNWMERVKEINVPIIVNVLWFEFCKAMEVGDFPHLGNIRLADEVQKYIQCENIQMKGVALRYKAFLQGRESQGHEEILKSLNLSSKFLSESGHTSELCRTYLELLRVHTVIGNSEIAHGLKLKISEMLGSSNQDFVPSDLQWFVKKTPRDWESLCDESMKLSQDISAIRDKKQLLQVVLSTANRILGAERGAIFSIGKHNNAPNILLTASKNITSADTNRESFKPVLEMVEEVATSRKGRFTQFSAADASSYIGHEKILSQIAVPMVVRNKVVGVLYHDNTHYANSFEEPDLKLLSGFASQAAIALDYAEAYAEIQRLNQKLNQEKQYYKEQSIETLNHADIIGASSGIMKVLKKISQVADTETTVLILGETGVGKDLVAKALHHNSRRKDQPFIKVLCNALPETLIASELFGHEKGAFTGYRYNAESAGLNWPIPERSSWTKSEIFNSTSKPSCCRFCKTRNSRGLEGLKRFALISA